MVRKEFLEVVTNTGMATLKELRRLTLNKDQDKVVEKRVQSFSETVRANCQTSNPKL